MADISRPNILFFLPDQHRADWTECVSDLPLRTPNLNRLASRGMNFTNAFTPSPLCAPARACLASGRQYERCGVQGNHQNYPLELPTYYQALRHAGYQVFGVGKFDLHKPTFDWGEDGSHLLEEWGFTDGIDNEGKLDGSNNYRRNPGATGPYLHFLHERGKADVYESEHRQREKCRDAYVTALDDDEYCDNWVAENGLRLVSNARTDRPWHLVINFTGPHNPMDVTASMHERWKNASFPAPHNNDDPRFTDEDHQRNRRHYAAMIENIDRHVGRFLDLVEARGELENTLIVYASDHGEMLGDHGKWGKSTWRQASVAVPLIAAGPGVRQNVHSSALVSLHDLAATFVDYAKALPPAGMDATSLRPVLEGRADAHRRVLTSGLRDWRCAFDGTHKLVVETDREDRLFDLRADPREDVDIAASSPGIVSSLKRALSREGVPGALLEGARLPASGGG